MNKTTFKLTNTKIVDKDNNSFDVFIETTFEVNKLQISFKETYVVIVNGEGTEIERYSVEEGLPDKYVELVNIEEEVDG